MDSIFDWLEPTEAGLFDISDGADRLRDVLRIHRSGERPELDGCVAALVGVMDRRGSGWRTDGPRGRMGTEQTVRPDHHGPLGGRRRPRQHHSRSH